MRSEGAVHLLRCSLCFSFYLLPPPFYLSSPLFFSPFFLLPQLSHPLLFFLSLSFVPLFSFFSFLPIILLFLSFSFVPFFFSLFFSFSPYHTPLSVFLLCPFFFLRELLVLSAFQDVIEDTTSCNRMQFI